ncbi:MAG TPA: FecR domain-containing protein [Caulobacteraceae bacterium]|nr:FecR domain-containing protein [Caulobacteraceae bacterium]
MGAGPRDSREALIAQASDWLVKLDSGSVDLAAFEEWRRSDARHAAAFAEVAAAWDHLKVLRGRSIVAPRQSTALRPNRRWLLRAAGLGGVTVLGGGLFAGQRAFARTYVETGVGERRTIGLPDGSWVELNTDTALSWRVTREVSHVWLERGQAAFTVAASPSRQFLLTTRDAEATMQPGQFDARIRNGALDVVVLSGGLKTRNGGEATSLHGSDGPARLFISGDTVAANPMTEADVNAATSWRRGEIVFGGAPLSSAVAEYNRYLTRKMVIGDPQISDVRLGGRFLTSNPGGFLLALHQAFGVRAVEESDQIVLLGQK